MDGIGTYTVYNLILSCFHAANT